MDLGDLLVALPRLIGDAVAASPLLGYGAIFAAMVLENVFPPIPSELIMPLGGFYVQQGSLQFVPVVLAGLLGTVVGALPWYGLGRLVNEQRLEVWLQRHGRWLGISVDELRRTRTWFARYGSAVVFWGRLVPGIRTLISVPARGGIDAADPVSAVDDPGQLPLDPHAHRGWHGAGHRV